MCWNFSLVPAGLVRAEEVHTVQHKAATRLERLQHQRAWNVINLEHQEAAKATAAAPASHTSVTGGRSSSSRLGGKVPAEAPDGSAGVAAGPGAVEAAQEGPVGGDQSVPRHGLLFEELHSVRSSMLRRPSRLPGQ